MAATQPSTTDEPDYEHFMSIGIELYQQDEDEFKATGDGDGCAVGYGPTVEDAVGAYALAVKEDKDEVSFHG